MSNSDSESSLTKLIIIFVGPAWYEPIHPFRIFVGFRMAVWTESFEQNLIKF